MSRGGRWKRACNWNRLQVLRIIRSPKRASERVVELVIGNMSGWILQDVGSVARPREQPPFWGGSSSGYQCRGPTAAAPLAAPSIHSHSLRLVSFVPHSYPFPHRHPPTHPPNHPHHRPRGRRSRNQIEFHTRRDSHPAAEGVQSQPSPYTCTL